MPMSNPMNNMSKQTRFHIGYWVAAMIGLLILQYFYVSAQKVVSIPYSQFQELLHDGKITKVAVSDRYLQGTLKEPVDGKTEFVSTRVDSQFAAELQKYGVTYSGEVGSTLLTDLLSWVVPALLFFGIWMFLSRRVTQGLGGGLMSIGKSKAKVYVESDTGVRFDDVAGVDEAKDELQEIVEFLKNPEQYSRLGGRMPKGILLVGPPGTGKTLLARAVAGQAKVPFFSISGSEFVEMFVGVGAARVRDLFEQARTKAPAIIFIDEDDGRRFGPRLLEQIAHAGGADADEHLDKLGAGNGEERHLGLAGHRLGQQRLAGTGRPDQQDAFRHAAAEPAVLLGILQKFDDLLQLVLGFVDAGDVVEANPGVGFDVDFGFALADRHQAAAQPLRHAPRQEHPDAEEQHRRNDPGEKVLQERAAHLPGDR